MINSHTSTSDAVVINGGVINNNNVVYTAYARNNSVTIDDAATIDASKPVYTY